MRNLAATLCAALALLAAAACLMSPPVESAALVDCPINRHTAWEVIAGKNVSKVLINIRLANGSCVEAFELSTPTTYTTSHCIFCMEGTCHPVPRLPSPPLCDSVQGPDCGQYFSAKGDRKAPCTLDPTPMQSSLGVLLGKK